MNMLIDSDQVPVLTAPDLSRYPQFAPATLPLMSGALRAWEGVIRPFSNDEEARGVLRAFQSNQPVLVNGGRLHFDGPSMSTSPWEAYLIDMALPCRVLLLEFKEPQHPRAYLLSPEMIENISLNPHVRRDKMLRVKGRLLPALCVYSGNIFKYEEAKPKLDQFLDQTSTYLAKHIIWLRTRMLFRRGPTFKLTRIRKPKEPVSSLVITTSKKLLWHGLWPGDSAPSGPEQHLKTVDPNGECWCWSGVRYLDCCYAREHQFVFGA